MKNMKVTILSTCLVAVFLGTSISVNAQVLNEEETRERSESPYFEIYNDDIDLENFPLKETNVEANISGVIADVLVNQVYENQGDRPINATYVFPASTHASVHGMTMTIGDYKVYAQIKEKEEAKTDFEEAKEEGKSASLLEETRPNVFTMSLANIMPGDVVYIEMHYSELIVPTNKVYEFVYPTVVGPRYGGAASAANASFGGHSYLQEGTENPVTFNITTTIDAPVPIAGVNCPSYDTNVTRYSDNKLAVSLAEEGGVNGNKDYILDYVLAGDHVQSGIILHEGEDENFFLMMLEPPMRIEPETITPREYIFVLDISGSMNGFPLETAKVLIKDLIGNLNNTDKFNVVLFAGASAKFSETSVEATSENISKAIRFITRHDGGGGTELLSALKDTVNVPLDENYTRSIAVITDGYIYEENAIYEFIENHLDEANFFSFGIGSSVNRFLIDGIAKSGQGEPFVVIDESDALETAAEFKTYIESPILTNIDINFNDFEVYDVEPKTIPTLFSDRPLIVYGKWEGKPTGSIKVSGVSGDGAYNNTIVIDEINATKNDALPYLWARKRVERLSDYNPNVYDNKDAIVEIGLKYSILTQHTSFIAIIEEIRNTAGDAVDVEQPLPLPEGVSELATLNYAKMSEPGDYLLVALLLGIVGIYVAMRRKGNVHETEDTAR